MTATEPRVYARRSDAIARAAHDTETTGQPMMVVRVADISDGITWTPGYAVVAVEQGAA